MASDVPMRLLITTTLCLILSPFVPSARALEYTCADDPGFCFFDVANDGCFDAGTDTGPIDAQLEGGPFPNPLPPGDDLPADPGSIICPPSVKSLSLPFGTDTDWRTALGGDIRIFAAKISYEAVFVQGQQDDTITLRSGRDVVLGQVLSVNPRNGSAVLVQAERDVTLEKGLEVKRSCPVPSQCHDVDVVTITGDVSVGPRGKLSGSRIHIDSGAGVTFADKVRVRAFDLGEGLRIDAAGLFELTNPKIESDGQFRSNTQGVSIDGVAKVKVRADGGSNEWDAGSGDFVAESLSLDWERVVILGQSIQIGSAAGKKSKLTARRDEVELTAADEISITNTDVVIRGPSPGLSLVQSGTSLSFTDSRVVGPSFGATAQVETGPGSTCDFTGTAFLFTTLVHDCGTVLGP